MELPFDPENPKYEYIKSQKRAEEVLELLLKEKVLSVDVEANSLDPYEGILFLVQISTREISYLFDARVVKLGVIPAYKELMEDKSRVKLFHNGKFDYKYLKVHTGVETANIYDTMLAQGVLFAGYNPELSLGEVTAHYFGPGLLDKTLQKSWINMTPNQAITESQLKYAGNDTLILFPIFEKQLQLLQKNDLMKIAKLEFAVTSVVAEMELAGVYVNQEKWMDIIKSLEIKMVDYQNQFQEAIKPYYSTSQPNLFGDAVQTININSNPQLMDLFNKKLNLNLPSTGNDVLQRVIHPVVDLLLSYRKTSKIVSTYGQAMIDRISKKTGRIHPDFLQIRTATGRFACNNPNLQNIPRNSEEAPFRHCFNPRPGYKMVVSDYSGFEMRILADLSGDEQMLKIFYDNLDIHSYTASLMFDKPYTQDFKKLYPDLRQMAKPIGFGLMYGMGAQGLIGRIYQETKKEITLEQSEDLITRYFKSYPSVKDFLDKMGKEAQAKGWSATPGGRKRWYKLPDKNDPEYRRKMSSIAREAKNHPIQGTNADAIKYALVFIYDRMKKEGVDGWIISTVHDEIVCEIREDQAEDFAKVLSDEMVRAGQLFLKKVPIRSDPFVGDVWEH